MARVKATANKTEQRTENLKLKSLGILSYDFDNKYPQRVIDISNDSGTASSCLKVHKRFVSGSGFTDPNLGAIKLNREGETADQLRTRIAESVGKFNGAIIHFNYNALGEKTEINFTPFEYGRHTLKGKESKYPDRIALYDDWGQTKEKKLEKERIKYLHKYAPSEVFAQMAQEEGDTVEQKVHNYEGQVWYWTPDGSDSYPLCPFDSVLEDCITEAQTKRFKTNSATTNFMPSHIIVTGREEVEQDEDGNPIDSNDEGLGKTLQQFQGGDGVAKLLHIEKDHDEEPFEVIPVEIQKYDGLLEHTEDSSTEDIVKVFGIPDILVLRRESGLGGNGNELYQAEKYLNKTTQTDRNLVSSIIEECFKGFVGNTGITDFSIIPLDVQRPIEPDDMQKMTVVIKDTELSRDQKSEMLKLVYKLSDSQIDKLLGT